MVLRVFQKSGSGKKARVGFAGSHYSESAGVPPSISSLPSLFDSSPYDATAVEGYQDSCSYKSIEREAVPCFSTIVATTATSGLGHHHLPPPPAPNMYGQSTARGVVGSVLPSLRSLQENLQLPFFLSMPATPVGSAAAAAMLCHGGVHHRVEEMGVNGWPSDLEWKADIHASVSELKSVRRLSFLKKLRLGSCRRWPWTILRPWIWSSLSTSSPPAPPLLPSTPPSLSSLTFPSSVAMDDPKTLDLELVVHLLSTRSPSTSVDPSTTVVVDLPVACGQG